MTADIRILALLVRIGLSVLLFVSSNTLNANEQNIRFKDLGIIGKTYPIIEEDMINMMIARLKQQQRSGEWEKKVALFRKSYQNYVLRPKGVKLPKAKQYRVTYLDSIYTVKEDIVDHQGKVLFRAGTTVNPLEKITLSSALYFFDGDDQDQVSWVLKHNGDNPLNKLILVNGPVIELMEKYKRRFFFDQGGYLINKMEIKSLPALVKQFEGHLSVEEFPID